MKKLLSMLIVFAISVCNVFGAISKQGIINAINEGRLGEYLLVNNAFDPGVQQFLRHCEKHFCDPQDIPYIRWLQINQPASVAGTYVGNPINDHHTVLGNGNWGDNATHHDTPIMDYTIKYSSDI